VLVAHQNPRDKVPVTQVPQGWVFTNAITSLSPWGVDTPKGATSPPRVLDDPQQSYADPSDVVLSPDQRHAFVACAGADTVLVLRTDKFVSANYGPLASTGERPSSLPPVKDDLALSRRYVKLRMTAGANPRRLAISADGRTLVASNHLDDSLTVWRATADGWSDAQTVTLGTHPANAVRRGARLFHSGKMTFQGQFSCASCHPNGHTDGLSWDLPRDGFGNFLNTRSLLGVRDTAPYGWLGTSATLDERVRSTLQTTHQHFAKADEVSDLTAYLRSLAPPRPLPVSEEVRKAAVRGQALFEGKGRCSSCHHGPALDDRVTHDIGTRSEGDEQDRFDTPSLRGVSRSAPYLHHGRARELKDVFEAFDMRKRHGGMHLLNSTEKADLLSYLLTL
jgi:hypothetical protein